MFVAGGTLVLTQEKKNRKKMHEIQFRSSFKLYRPLLFGSRSKISQQFQRGTRTKTFQVTLY